MKDFIPDMGDYKPGTWVRFYRDGRLVIGEVKYLWRESGGHYYLATDIGTVNADDILEFRISD